MAMAMPPRVIVLIVAPKARSTSIAAASESGIAVNVIAAARRFARNNSTTIMTRMAAVAKRADDVVDRDFNEIRLAEDLAIDGHSFRELLLQTIELSVKTCRELRSCSRRVVSARRRSPRACRCGSLRRV